MSKKRVFFALISLSFVVIIFYIYSYSNNYNYGKQNNYPPYNYEVPKSTKPRNQLWEQMNEYVFFKRSSAYYIIEDSLLRIYFITKTEISLSLDMILVCGNTTILAQNVRYEMKETRSNYNLNLLYYKFNMLNTFDAISYDNIKLKLYFTDMTHVTQYPIDVKIKNLKSTNDSMKKEGSIICSKCFYFTPDEHEYLRWWIELNKQFGYRKLVFCNQSIPNTAQFNRIFKDYKDFIELKQFRFMPNFNDLNRRTLLPDRHEYLTEYFELNQDRVKVYNQWYVDEFDVMHTNECFLENADKYEYVAVVDNDETIIPRVNTKFKLKKDTFDYVSKFDQDMLENEIQFISASCHQEVSNKIEAIIDTYIHSYGPNKNYNFHMAYYLRDVDVKKIFNAFEAYFTSSYFKQELKEHIIEVIDLEPASIYHKQYNYSFLIKNTAELNYARNLLFLYRNFIEKFENEYKDKLSSYSEQFHRYFYISGNSTDWKCGKSIWHTDHTSEYSVHYGIVAERWHHISLDSGHNGHFRRWYPFKPENISINELSLDFNYLSCFYKPIIQKFENINIF